MSLSRKKNTCWNIRFAFLTVISQDVYKSGGGHTEQELPHVGVFFGGGSKVRDVHRDSTS